MTALVPFLLLLLLLPFLLPVFCLPRQNVQVLEPVLLPVDPTFLQPGIYPGWKEERKAVPPNEVPCAEGDSTGEAAKDRATGLVGSRRNLENIGGRNSRVKMTTNDTGAEREVKE
jgi:hypothetical protein